MKQLIFVFFFIVMQLPLYSQSLSDDENFNIVFHTEKVLDECLHISENNKQQRTVQEREAYVHSLIMIAKCYNHLARYEEGYKLCEKLLDETLTDKQKSDVNEFLVMNGYGWAMNMEDDTYARKLLNRIFPLADEDMKQKIIQFVSFSWYFEGAKFFSNMMYDKALSCMEKAMEGFHKIHYIEYEINSIIYIGNIKRNQGDLLESLDAYQHGISLAKESKMDYIHFTTLKKQVELCQMLGRIELSDLFVSQIDSLANITNSKEVKSEYYYFKGKRLQNQGKYQLAEKMYLQNIPDERDEIDYLKHFDNFCSVLYDLYIDMGNYNKALEYARKMLDFAISSNNKHTYSRYFIIAYAYGKMRDSVNCFLAIDSLSLPLNRLEEPREIASLYGMRGLAYRELSMYDHALNDFEKAEEALATKYNEYDKERIDILGIISDCEYMLKYYEKAIKHQTAYAEKIKALYGERSTSYIRALAYLAKIVSYGGYTKQGCRTFATAASLIRNQTKSQLPFYSGVEREHFWIPYSEILNNMTLYALRVGDVRTVFTETCYDNLVLTKSFLLETERSAYDVIKKNGNESDLCELNIISNLNGRIKEIEKGVNMNVDSITALISLVDSLENKLTKKCRSYGDITSFIDIGYKEIKNALKANEVLIDFTDYRPDGGGREYAAFLVERNQKHPFLQKLFAESTIDSLGVTRPTQYYDKVIGFEMTKLIWNPFKNHVQEGATVYYVPSQLLFQIALESLPLEDGTLLGDHYRFVRLSSSRAILNVQSHLSKDMAHHNDAILYGGLKYDMSSDEMNVESKQYDISSLLATRGDIARGDSIFRYLPQTKVEIDEIGKILRSGGMSTHPFTGTKGTEESFWSMHQKSPRILHIATHGFYYTPDEAQKNNYLRGYTDAMLLSGIILSGGNAAWLGKDLPDGALGGVLTADDIARIDLSNTELVVLSACQTGQGKATREGLFGLQRAFKKAGVKTIVMSLWNISDVVTKEFMVKFYENLVKNGWDKQNAFIDAKDYIRTKPGYDDPYYWAGFVMLD